MGTTAKELLFPMSFYNFYLASGFHPTPNSFISLFSPTDLNSTEIIVIMQ